MSTQQDSKMLEGIERIHWETTSCLCFVGALAASARYLGDDVSNDYVMGISGGAFKMYWLLPWAPSNCDLLMVGEEPVRRAFSALGYSYTWISDPGRQQPREFYRDRIVAAIDAGRPVLADGVVGPPEICVVTGYEDGGNILRGWSYFQEDPSEPFRAADWHNNIYGLILIGQKGPKPAPREVLRSSLEWAAWLGHTPAFEGVMEPGTPECTHMNGLAAYDTLAQMLLRDEEFVDVGSEGMMARLCAIGNDGLFLLPMKRRSAVAFLEEMDRAVPECADDLRRAADAYKDEILVLDEAGKHTPWSGMGEEDVRQRLSPENRARLSGLVCEARAHEERALACLDAALAGLA